MELCFARLPSAVSYCLDKLDDDLKTKDEILRTLIVDLSENAKLALAGIDVTPTSTMGTLKENIAARFPSLPLVQAFSIFELQVLPATCLKIVKYKAVSCKNYFIIIIVFTYNLHINMIIYAMHCRK